MKILVPIKRVIDAYAKIRVKSDRSAVETNSMKMVINPFDEIAIEEALRIKEQGVATEVVAVSIGPTKTAEQLRAALALGCDSAVHIEHTDELLPLHVAKCLRQVVQNEQADLVIMGKQSIDGDHNQTGQMLAALLDWPQATFASKVDFSDQAVVVQREIDGGLETLQVVLPAVITTDLRLNEPRYATLPSIMKAKQKPLSTQTIADLGVNLSPHLSVTQVCPPEAKEGGIRLETVEALVQKLRDEAKVI